MSEPAIAEHRLTYERLRRQLRPAVLGHAFLRGELGPLAFIWSIGLVPLVLAAETPLYAGLWTGATLLLGALSIRLSFKNPQVLTQVVAGVVERSLPRQRIANPSLNHFLQKSQAVFGEIALRVIQAQPLRQGDAGLHRLIAEAHSLLALQQQSAVQAEEFERTLAFVNATLPDRIVWAGSHQGDRSAERLRQANLVRVRDEVLHQERMVGEILEQLETLLLQVVQFDLQPWNVVESAELVRSSEANLRALQQDVIAREQVARRVIAELAQQ